MSQTHETFEKLRRAAKGVRWQRCGEQALIIIIVMALLLLREWFGGV